ncbi:transmembrane amino acid transporter [Nitzschia inconspicua]|uniref:Transmembrane amino acid transporter n=1 Tax=Nitzschia inconspicua TaxID=303405 RepID=A0A9K3LP60_9STRA|nr:transmembrane amino acid transporter [Nitzschia inconspicua]
MSSTEWKDLLQHIDGESTATTRTTTAASLAQLRDNHPSNNNNNKSIEKNAVFEVSTNQHPQRDNRISDWEASVSLAKAIMGAGSFALPWAFSKMGYITGPIFMTLLLTMSVYSIQLLVQCCSLLRRKQEQQQQQQQQQQQSHPSKIASVILCSYVDVARSTFGTTGARCAYIASMSASIGVCGSYLVFIASNIESLLETSTLQDKDPSTSTPITSTQDTTTTFTRTTTWIWMILPVVVLLSAIRDMKYFAMSSFLGDVSVILGMVVVMVYGITDTSSNSSQSWWGDNCAAVGSLRDMALAFGSIGYLFLVHFLVIPIESSMDRPQHFPKVATITFTACAIGSGIFGIVGYLMFGTETEQIVLLNVRHGSVFVVAVKVLLCIDLILTYPVVMRPSIVILEESMDLWWKQRQVNQQKKTSIETATMTTTTTTTTQSEHHHHQHHPKVNTAASTATTTLDGRHLFVCTILGVVAASASSFIPAFGILSGLVGGVSQTFLAFVLPPLMWTKIQQQQQQTNPHRSSSLSSSILWELPTKEKGLVVCGCVLIVWTLHSTWTELRTTTT